VIVVEEVDLKHTNFSICVEPAELKERRVKRVEKGAGGEGSYVKMGSRSRE